MNRLITRVILCPACLSNPDAMRNERDLEFVDVPAALRELHDQLKRQIAGVRASDSWAAGDLALVSALIGNDQEAISALEKFAANSPSMHAYQRYLESFATLAKLDTPARRVLANAQAWVEEQMSQSSR